jgi:hypothetical protein
MGAKAIALLFTFTSSKSTMAVPLLTVFADDSF